MSTTTKVRALEAVLIATLLSGCGPSRKDFDRAETNLADANFNLGVQCAIHAYLVWEQTNLLAGKAVYPAQLDPTLCKKMADEAKEGKL